MKKLDNKKARKLIDKANPFKKRYVKADELATLLVNCFRDENGNFPERQTFMNGSLLVKDKNGETVFYPATFIDGSISRLNVIINNLRDGEVVDAQRLIPDVTPRARRLTTSMSALNVMRDAAANDLTIEEARYMLASAGYRVNLPLLELTLLALKKHPELYDEFVEQQKNPNVM